MKLEKVIMEIMITGNKMRSAFQIDVNFVPVSSAWR